MEIPVRAQAIELGAGAPFRAFWPLLADANCETEGAVTALDEQWSTMEVKNYAALKADGTTWPEGATDDANRNRMFSDTDPVYQAGGIYEKPEYLRKDYIIEQGLATGFDVSLTADLDRIYLWATYSLGYVQRTDEIRTYNPHYDRRHTFNLLGTYTFGSQNDWELSGRWTFGSGFPFTQTQGVFQQLPFGDGIVTDYTRENGEYSIHYAELYKGRLPAYHRLDLGIKRKFSLGRRSILELSLSATNIYSRENIFYFNRITFERVNQLPILVCAGATLTF